MPVEDLTALASLAGSTVVAAAATDASEVARREFARLLGRGDPDRTKLAERRLTETHEELIKAVGGDLESARSALEAQWVTQLADLLKEDPAVEADLRAVVGEIQAALPGGMVHLADHAVAAGREVNIRADRGGLPAGVVYGDVMPPGGPTSPGPATSYPGPGSLEIQGRARRLRTKAG